MPSDDLDDLIQDLEGASPYTATQKPKGDQRKTLQPEGGKEITEPDQNPKPRIQKVSKMLRDNKNMEKYYEPRVVSIGLLHYDRDKFNLAEGHKLKLAELFITENGVDELGLHKKIKAKIVRLKQCYAEEDAKRVNIKNENLAWMFLIDGFALLNYICYASLGKLNDLKKIGMDMEAFSQDLFLLENQIPYEVLEDIMTSVAKGGANMRNLIDKFIDQTVMEIRGSPLTSPSPQQQQQQQLPPTHLLQFLRNRLVGDHDHHKTNEKTKTGKRVGRVNELKSAGIQLISGTEGSLDNISFSSHWLTAAGTLTLPCLVVNGSTIPKLLNLIAFEMSPDFQNDSQVITSYIFFLHSLIDQPDDIKELRKAHVLLINNNNDDDAVAGSDEEVARLFKEIGSSDVGSIPEAYLEVKELIQKHCEKKWKTWMTLFAFAAAAIALLVMSFSSRLGVPASN